MPVSLFVGQPQAVDEPADSDDNGPGLQLSELNPDDSFNSQMLQMPFGEKRQPTFSRHEALFFAWTASFRAGFFRCSIRPETRQSPFQILRRNRTRFSGILDKSQTLRIAWFRAESNTILQYYHRQSCISSHPGPAPHAEYCLRRHPCQTRSNKPIQNFKIQTPRRRLQKRRSANGERVSFLVSCLSLLVATRRC